MKKLFSHVLNFFSYIYSRLINFNLILINLSNKNFYYNHSLAFGDSMCYYLHNYKSIIYSKNKIPLAFGGFQEEIVDFFFPKYKKIFFKIYFYMPYYRICKYLYNASHFKPIINYHLDKNNMMTDELLLKNDYDFTLKRILKKKKIRFEIKELARKRYICFFFKYYNNNVNDVFSLPSVRQTTDINKIVDLISYLILNEFKIFVFGDYKDKGTVTLKKKYFNDPNIYFTEDFNANVTEQIYIANQSMGFVGNQAGTHIPFLLLKKKTLVFDCISTPYIKINTNLPHATYLFKKIIIRKKKYKLHTRHLNYKKKYTVLENNFAEIKKNIKEIFL
jgi:hypothetical protein